MSNKEQEIITLLETSHAPAPDVTKPLKEIGNGNMLDGVKNIFKYARTEGELVGYSKGLKVGVIGGSLFVLAAGTALYGGHKLHSYIVKKDKTRKEHEQTGERICSAFKEELADNDVKEVIDTDVESIAETNPNNEEA